MQKTPKPRTFTLNPRMTGNNRNFSRRDFLKLATLGTSTLAFRPFRNLLLLGRFLPVRDASAKLREFSLIFCGARDIRAEERFHIPALWRANKRFTQNFDGRPGALRLLDSGWVIMTQDERQKKLVNGAVFSEQVLKNGRQYGY